MARPETIADLGEEIPETQLANFETGELNKTPHLLAVYTLFVSLVVADGGSATSYGQVTRPKSDADLAELLKSRQRTWDSHQTSYDKAQLDRFDVASYSYPGLNDWAKKEGLPALVQPSEGEYVRDKAAKLDAKEQQAELDD